MTRENNTLDGDGTIPEVVQEPITDTLDLHTFNPKDLKDLLPDYLEECRKKGILEVRIIHGKGKGILRKRVHSILSSLSFVKDFSLAGPYAGGWGATVLHMKPRVKKGSALRSRCDKSNPA